MPVLGICIITCVEIKLSPAYIGNISSCNHRVSSPEEKNAIVLFVLHFHLLMINSFLSWLCSSWDTLNQEWRLARVASVIISGRYPKSLKLCTIVRQHAQSIFPVYLLLISTYVLIMRVLWWSLFCLPHAMVERFVLLLLNTEQYLCFSIMKS